MPMILLLASESTQVTTNPNAWDSWLGRFYTITAIIAALYGLYRLAHRSFKQAIDEQTQDLRRDAQTVKAALDLHTDQEATIVRAEISQALLPVMAELGRLSGRVEAISDHQRHHAPSKRRKAQRS